MQHFWTCQRQTGGAKCGHRSPARKRYCERCGKPRPARRKPAHLSALTLDYEAYVVINGGDYCGVCGRKPSANRKLDRDHDHATHKPRGLLCHRHNRGLRWFNDDPEELRLAIGYLERER